MSGTILVINPNSTESVTDGISAALAPLRFIDGPEITCVTLRQGPPAIESDADVAAVVEPLCALIEAADAEAFVIACYSDPGLAEARRCTNSPVFGMAESGMSTALTRGTRFGVVSILAASVERHRAYVERLGLTSRQADLPLKLGVLELGDPDRVWDRLVGVGRTLRDTHRADVVLLGCAGMAQYRADLEHQLGIPVIDPTQAAVMAAIGAVTLAL